MKSKLQKVNHKIALRLEIHDVVKLWDIFMNVIKLSDLVWSRLADRIIKVKYGNREINQDTPQLPPTMTLTTTTR